MSKLSIRASVLALAALTGFYAGPVTAESQEALEKRVRELEKTVEALTSDVEKTKLSDVIPEPGESVYGMGPSASKVYNKQHGVSIGGYGEMLYQNFDDSSKRDEIDFLRWVLYAGYKYNDKFVFNSEIELEHAADDKEGEVAVEFAYIDYLHDPALNFRAGMVLLPMGLVNELHEPITYLSARRPDVENRIIPTTWRENGAGVFGDVGPFSYKAYIVNGLDAEGFTAAGVRGGRQKGSKAAAEDFSYVGRLDYTDVPGLIVGGSAYYGNSGSEVDLDVATLIYEGHIDWKWKGLDVRALAAAAEVDDVAELNTVLAEKGEVALTDFDSIGEDMVGWYLQVGYDILTVLRPGEASLTPYVRYEQYNTQDSVPEGFDESGKNDVDVITTGINFKPIQELAIKAEYQFYDDEADSASDQFNASLGYVF